MAEVAALITTLCSTLPQPLPSSCIQTFAPPDHIAPPAAWAQADSYINSRSAASLPSPGSPRELHLALGRRDGDIMVTWVTRSECEASQVEYSLSKLDSGDGQRINASTYTYTTPRRWWPEFKGYIHSAVMTGLTPGTSFQYKVGVFVPPEGSSPSCGASAVVTGNVPPPAGSFPTKMALMADVGSVMPLGFMTWKALIERAGSLGVDIAVHAGDVSYAGMDTDIKLLNISKKDEFEPLWDLYGEVIEPFAQAYPYQVGVGNHEAWYNFTAVRHRFPMSHQHSSSADYAEPPFFYSFNTGGIQVVMLSSEHEITPGSRQYHFAEQAFQTTDRSLTPWLFVAFHKPYYVSDDHYTNEGLRASIENLLVTYGVDLVVTGHLHAYERIHPVNNRTVAQFPTKSGSGEDVYVSPRAPVYVMIGNGGAGQVEKWTKPAPDWSAVRFAQGCDYTKGRAECGVFNGTYSYTNTFGFSVAHALNRTHLKFHTEMVTGSMGDTFWLVKN